MKSRDRRMALSSHRNVLCLAFSFLLFPLGSGLQKADFDATCHSKENKTEKALRDVGTTVVKIIENGKPMEILKHFAQAGVAFGLEPPPIQLSMIENQFRKREGVYCVLFDGKCLRSEVQRNRKQVGTDQSSVSPQSIRETLAGQAPFHIETQILLIDAKQIGYVTISWKTNQSERRVVEPIRLEFEYVNCRWWLTAILYG